MEASISEAQSELAEAVEAGQELAAYEPEEDESITASVIKAALKAVIDDLKDSKGESAKKELKALQAQEKTITLLEKRIKDSKAEVKTLTDELDLKLQLKRIGDADYKAESQQLLTQVTAQIAELDPEKKEDKKKLNALQKDHAALEQRLAKTDALFTQIGGRLTDEEAKALILKKLHNLATHELNRYLNSAKRQLIQSVETLWDKYAVSSRALETARTETLKALDGFLTGLGYLK
jgi:type I restriction enzyme M protein